MLWTILFTAAIGILLLRAFTLRAKANRLDFEEFKNLSDETKLAVLKETLLDYPSVQHLKSLENFCREHEISIQIEEYLPLLEQQKNISREPDALALDSLLYEKQIQWLDSLTPLEWTDAEIALKEKNISSFIRFALKSLLYFYSDEKIEFVLNQLEPYFPEARELKESYLHLTQARDQSKAGEKDLEYLQKLKADWNDLIQNKMRTLENHLS